jgi:hypothetical protein
MRHSIILAALVCFQAQGVDEQTASANLDAAIKGISGYNLNDEPKPIGDEVFLKRLLKDLINAAPTEAELKAFVNDPDPKKRSAMIARVVEDDRFSPFWAGRFTELFFGDPEKLKFTEIYDRPPGLEIRVVKYFKEWLAGKFKKDVPWNEIVSAMLDARGTTEGEPALAYLLSFHRGRGLAVEFPSGVARYFLGIRLTCAQCHDHPYDKWRTEDYYGLSSFVIRQKVRRVGDALELKYADEGDVMMPSIKGSKSADVRLSRGGQADPNFLFGGTAGKNDDRMKILAGHVTGKPNSQLPRAWVNRIWGWLFGYGIVHPVDDFNFRSKALSPALLESLVRDMRDHEYSLKRLVRVICNTANYQMPTPEELPLASTFRHSAKLRLEQGPYYPLSRTPPALPVSFDAPAKWTRVSARDGAKATYLIPDKSDKTRFIDLSLRSGKVDKSTMDSLNNQFENRKSQSKEELVEGKTKVSLTEISGKYCCDRKLDGPTDYLIWMAGFEAADGKSYHVRLQGPVDSVGGWREEFLSLLKSLGKCRRLDATVTPP